MKTRHVWLLPALDVGEPQQGYVLHWRRVQVRASPPRWDAFVIYVDRSETARGEWVPSTYLRPVEPDPPPTLGRGQ